MENEDCNNATNRAFANILWLFDAVNNEEFAEIFVAVSAEIIAIKEKKNKQDLLEKIRLIIDGEGSSNPIENFDPSYPNTPEFNVLRKLFQSLQEIEGSVYQWKDEPNESSLIFINQFCIELKEFSKKVLKVKKELRLSTNPNYSFLEVPEKKLKELNTEFEKIIHTKLDKLKHIHKKLSAFIELIAFNGDFTDDKDELLKQVFGDECHHFVLYEYAKKNISQIDLYSAQPLIEMLKTYQQYLDEKITLIEINLEFFNQINLYSFQEILGTDLPIRSEKTLDLVKVCCFMRNYYGPYYFYENSGLSEEELSVFRRILAAQRRYNFFDISSVFNHLFERKFFDSFERFVKLMVRDDRTQISYTHFYRWVDRQSNFSQLQLEYFPKSDILDWVTHDINENRFELPKLLRLDIEQFNAVRGYEAIAHYMNFFDEISNDNTPLVNKYLEQYYFHHSRKLLDFAAAFQVRQNEFMSRRIKEHKNLRKRKTTLYKILNSRYTGFSYGNDNLCLIELDEITKQIKSRKEKAEKEAQQGGKSSGPQNSSNLIVQDFPGEIGSDTQQTKTFQTYEEYLDHMMKKTHRKLIEEANKKFEKNRSQLGKKQMPYISGDHRYGKDENQNTIYALQAIIHNPLTLKLFANDMLAVFNILGQSTVQNQAQVISFANYQNQTRFYKKAGGMGGHISRGAITASQLSKNGKVIPLKTAGESQSNFSSALNSSTFHKGEALVFGISGLYHTGKFIYYVEPFVSSLILSLQGKKGQYTAQESVTVLSTIGVFAALLGKLASQMPKGLLGYASVSLMVNDLVKYGQKKLTKILLEYYGLAEGIKTANITKPKLQRLVLFQKAAAAFKNEASQENKMKMILAMNYLLEPALTQFQTYLQLSDKQFVSLTPRRYRHDQEHYISGELVLSVPKIFAIHFNHAKTSHPAKANIQFASIQVIEKDGSIREFQKTYIGPEGELYLTQAEQTKAWASYGSEQKDFLDLIQDESMNKAIAATSTSYQLVLDKRMNSVRVLDSTVNREVGKLLLNNDSLQFVSTGSMQGFQSAKLDEFVKYAKSQVAQIKPSIIQSNLYKMNWVFQEQKQIGPGILKTLQSFTKTLYEAKQTDKEFYHFVMATKPSEGYKIIQLIDMIEQKGRHYVDSALFKYNHEKKVVKEISQQFQHIAFADYCYKHMHLRNIPATKSSVLQIQNPYDIVFAK